MVVMNKASAVASGLKKLSRVLDRWRERRHLRRELASAPKEERARLLHDLDVQPAQIGGVLTGTSAPRGLLPRMMQRYGVDPEAVADELLAVTRDLQRTCSLCTHKRICHRALERGATLEECQRFCPNSATLASLNS